MTGIPTTEEFGCRRCAGRGDLKWLSTHSHWHPGRANPLLLGLWKLTERVLNRKAVEK